MQILSAEQIKACDAYTISQEGISSSDLMERAAKACIPGILKFAGIDSDIIVFCGMGNNGGDGLAIARLLIMQHYTVHAVLVHHSDAMSEDCQRNFDALSKLAHQAFIHVHKEEDLKAIPVSEKSILVDALLGIGLNRPVEGLLADAIDFINALHGMIVSIDIPSGMYADSSSKENRHIVKPVKTFTFQTPKLAFLMAENAAYTTHFDVLNIGLSQEFMLNLAGCYSLLQQAHIRFLIKPRAKFSHKGTYGHALLIGGSKGKSGAIILSARACLHSGAGLLTVHSCAETIAALLAQLPEAMGSYDEEPHISTYPQKGQYAVVAIGPGLGNEPATQQVLKLLIQNATQPLVLDADAINILSDNRTWLSFVPAGSVFTPHVKEFDRLTMAHQSDFDRLETAIEFCRKQQQIVVLKGTYTAVITPSGKVYFNSTGNPALAKGGSGDVLTGIIAGLIARGYEPEQACVIGVYLHGLSADLCVKKQSMESVLASDIIDKLGKAFLKVGS